MQFIDKRTKKKQMETENCLMNVFMQIIEERFDKNCKKLCLNCTKLRLKIDVNLRIIKHNHKLIDYLKIYLKLIKKVINPLRLMTRKKESL